MLRKDWDTGRFVARRIKLRDLHIMFAVAELGSMAKAASHRSITQPTVSQAIADLEDAIGVRLFERSTQGVTLTAYGTGGGQNDGGGRLKAGGRPLHQASFPTSLTIHSRTRRANDHRLAATGLPRPLALNFHRGSTLYKDTDATVDAICDLMARHPQSPFRARYYSSAPSQFMLLVDDRVLVWNTTATARLRGQGVRH